MRVALDMTPALVGSTGAARYATELRRALTSRGVELGCFAVGRSRRPVPPGVRHVPLPLRLVQRSWALAGRPRAEDLVPGADLVHSLDLVPPPSRLPTVVTVHDVVALEHPHLHSARAVAQQRARLRALSDVDLVLASSQATAAALVRHGVDEGRIEVVPLGATDLPPPRAPGLRGPYLLAVGALAPRKGYEVLLKALARGPLTGTRLVLAGPPERAASPLAALASSLGVADRVTALGPVDDASLAGLYSEAVALCFPSLAEGFGLPIVEAMAAGVPVVASDLDVLREVVGDAALLTPPGDDAALAAALGRLLQEPALRDDLRCRGRARAQHFTWEKTAAATAAAYERVLLA